MARTEDQVARIEDVTRVKCPECGRGFPSQQSLQQHRRLVHPGHYNRDGEVTDSGARRLWSDLEVRQLAEAEVRLENDPAITFINKALPIYTARLSMP